MIKNNKLPGPIVKKGKTFVNAKGVNIAKFPRELGIAIPYYLQMSTMPPFNPSRSLQVCRKLRKPNGWKETQSYRKKTNYKVSAEESVLSRQLMFLDAFARFLRKYSLASYLDGERRSYACISRLLMKYSWHFFQNPFYGPSYGSSLKIGGKSNFKTNLILRVFTFATPSPPPPLPNPLQRKP